MKGKAALVTGAASGMGRGTAMRLADLGADVCLVDDAGTALAEVADLCRSKGVRAESVFVDLASPDVGTSAVEPALAAFGRLDALCNIANAFFPVPTTTMRREDWQTTLAVNLSTPFYLIQAAIPHLIETNGAIVNVTSCVAFMSPPNTAAYAATKAGLTHMTKALAAEFMNQTIRINAVAPGRMAMSLSTKGHIPDDLDRDKMQRTHEGRLMVPLEQVVEVIAYLASPAGEGFHGSTILLDNGLSIG